MGIARFSKVDSGQFCQDFIKLFPSHTTDEALAAYAALQLPRRATQGSAGYDFFSPLSFELEPGEGITIPTGIRAQMHPGWVLALFPRSGLGFQYRLQLDNSVGIVDQDYYYSDNQGHIFIKLTNDGRRGRTLTLEAGKGFAQGIFLPFGLVEEDEAGGLRNGGFGSSGA